MDRLGMIQSPALRLKVALHPVDTDRDAVDERERLRVFRHQRSEHARDNVSKIGSVSP
jgi:hypothetical protein